MPARRWFAAAIAVLALAGVWFMFYPIVQDRDLQEPVEAPLAESAAAVSITGARVVLPAVAGSPARGYFVAANKGKNSINLTRVAATDATGAEFQNPQGTTSLPIEQVTLDPGEAVTFKQGGPWVAIKGYNENVVPGATVQLTFTLDDSSTVTVPARVEAEPPDQRSE